MSYAAVSGLYAANMRSETFLEQHHPLNILSLPGRVGPEKPEPLMGSIIYKEILETANENLDDLVPVGIPVRAPTQAVAVLATLAAVTHGGRSHSEEQRRGILLWPW